MDWEKILSEEIQKVLIQITDRADVLEEVEDLGVVI